MSEKITSTKTSFRVSSAGIYLYADFHGKCQDRVLRSTSDKILQSSAEQRFGTGINVLSETSFTTCLTVASNNDIVCS